MKTKARLYVSFRALKGFNTQRFKKAFGLRVLLATGFILFIISCSTTKDRFINREWQALNSKYNVLFNGEMAFDKAWTNLQNGYTENFWELLPIERFVPTTNPQLNNPNFTESPFALAEEKAVKAIKLHGMTIKGEEKNRQMVHAYSLLGRARYFDQRFVPALEAFNYIIRRYPASNALNEVRIWKEKTNLRLGNEDIALENINRLLKYRDLKGQILADAHAVRAQAYLGLQVVDSATWDLKNAVAFSKKPIKKARYGYLMGQLYQAQQKPDSALWAYQGVVKLNRKISRIFLIQAQLQVLFLKAKAGNTDQEAIGALTKLEQNWENEPFLDRIYYEKAQLLRGRYQDSAALVYANKSLRASILDPKRNAENYRLMARIYFDQAQYKKAGKHYDSLSQNLSKTSTDYRRTLKKIKGLKDLVLYENQSRSSDSLLRLSALSKTALAQFVQEVIAKEKALEQQRDSLAIAAGYNPDSLLAKASLVKDLLSRETQKEGATKPNANPPGNTSAAAPSANRQSSFYFYNPSAVKSGAAAFKQTWGDRALANNWRWIITPKTPENSGATPATETLLAPATEKEIPKEFLPRPKVDWALREAKYMAGIPTKNTVLDSLNRVWEQAQFQLGRLYFEDFNRTDLAQERLETLLKKPPSEALMPPTLYALYKLYLETGSIASEGIKSRILKTYPESIFARFIIDPSSSALAQDLFEQRYDTLYQAYQAQDFATVMTGTTQMLSALAQDPKGAALALLQANTIGRLYGLPAYKSALKKLIEAYPNMPVAQTAKSSLEGFKENPPQKTFNATKRRERFYLALLYKERYNKDSIAAYMSRFKTAFPKYKIQREVFNPTKTFYIISGFSDYKIADAFKKDTFFTENPLDNSLFFVILASHYKTLQLFKDLEAYKQYNLEQKAALETLKNRNL